MRKLLLGNEAVARGLYEAGCRVASSYPGTPSTEVTESAAKYDEIYCEWAPNEKVAMETAGGAAIAGARSFCGMKHVGLNVAADPLFTLSYTGVNAGMVIALRTIPECIHRRMSRIRATMQRHQRYRCSSPQILRNASLSRSSHMISPSVTTPRL